MINDLAVLSGARGADRDAGTAFIQDGPVIVDGDISALLKIEILIDGDEGLRHFADRDHARAVGIDLGGHKCFCAVGQRHHHDHGGHANDHPQQREDGPHLIGPQ